MSDRPLSRSGRSRAGQEAGKVEVTSGFGANTHQPYVEINWPVDGDNISIQLSPSDARAVGHLLLSQAETADQDAFLVNFLCDHIGIPFEEAARVLPHFAAWRAEHTTGEGS